MRNKTVLLNRFFLRPLKEEDLTLELFEVLWEPPLVREENPFRLLGRLAGRVGRTATPWNGKLLVRGSLGLREGEVRGEAGSYRFRLLPLGLVNLDLDQPENRKALERLAQKELEYGLREYVQRQGAELTTGVPYEVEGGLLLGKEVKSADGWSIRKGASLRIRLEPEGLFLEVDIVHRIVPKLTLEEWLRRHPPPPRVRNTYPNQAGRRQTWVLVGVEESLRPEEVMVGEVSLLAYHQARGRLGEREEPGRVVRVRDEKGKEAYHLSGLLEPVLSLEDLAELYPDGVPSLQIIPQERFEATHKVARLVARKVLGLTEAPQPRKTAALVLPRPQLRARDKRVSKPAEVLRVGALKARGAKVALLVVDGPPAWPKALEEALRRLEVQHGVVLRREPPIPVSRKELQSLSLAASLDALAQAGVGALLVSTPFLAWEERNALKRALLQRGFPSQFFNPPLEGHKLDNVLLGLLNKLGWRLLALEGSYPAELAIGFDAGAKGDRSLRYGGAACAVTADGGLLAWMLPEAQRGERMAGEVVWSMTQEALLRFRREHGRWPNQVLLLRDGKTQREEFTLTLQELERAGIGYDLVSVRKTGGGRIFPVKGDSLSDGVYVPLFPGEGGKGVFLLLTAYPGPKVVKGTPRPLKVVHEEGSTPLEELARHIYHLSRLYPPSGYRFPSLPAPLHLADRLVREVGRLGVSALHGLDRGRLFFV